MKQRIPSLATRVAAAQLVVIGGSLGGTTALRVLLEHWPGELMTPIIVALHRYRASKDVFASMLQPATRRIVREADDRAPIEPGQVYVAPADYHLLVEHGILRLSVEGRVHHCRPSIDVLFESAADAYRSHTVGIVLSGANEDGAAGARRIRDRGGVVLVQDPATAEAPQMPAAAAPFADRVLSLNEISQLFAQGLQQLATNESVRTGQHPSGR